MQDHPYIRNGELAVEARLANGGLAPAARTHAASALRRLARLGCHLALGAALVGGVMGIKRAAAPDGESGNNSNNGVDKPFIALSVNWSERDVTEMARFALGTIDAQARNGIDRLQVNEKAATHARKRPAARVEKVAGRRVCTITLQGLEHVHIQYLRPDERTPAMSDALRKFVVAHEAAHCDFLSKIESPVTLGQNSDLARLLRAIQKLDQSTSNVQGLKVGHVSTNTLLERQADTKALLVVARETIGKVGQVGQDAWVRQEPEMASQVAAFARLASAVIQLRKRDEAREHHLRTHDTSAVLQATSQFVLRSTQSPEQMGILMEVLQDSASMNAWSEWMAVASLAQDLPQIASRVIVGEMRVSKSRVALAQVGQLGQAANGRQAPLEHISPPHDDHNHDPDHDPDQEVPSSAAPGMDRQTASTGIGERMSAAHSASSNGVGTQRGQRTNASSIQGQKDMHHAQQLVQLPELQRRLDAMVQLYAGAIQTARDEQECLMSSPAVLAGASLLTRGADSRASEKQIVAIQAEAISRPWRAQGVQAASSAHCLDAPDASAAYAALADHRTAHGRLQRLLHRILPANPETSDAAAAAAGLGRAAPHERRSRAFAP